MYRLTVLLIFASLLSDSTAAGQCKLQATETLLRNKDPQVLREVEQQWLRAYGEKNTEALDCILVEDFQIGSMPDEKGELHDKRHVLDWVAQRSPSVQKIERLDLKPYGNVAVVRGAYSISGEDGRVLARYQFMDVLVYRKQRWQALTREIAELLIK